MNEAQIWNPQKEIAELKHRVLLLEDTVKQLSKAVQHLSTGGITYGGMQVDPSYMVNAQLWDKTGLPVGVKTGTSWTAGGGGNITGVFGDGAGNTKEDE
jgi:hypothetical protein